MIKTNSTILTELHNIQDNLNALFNEFSKENAYEGYVDEKLGHIEQSSAYLRGVTEKAAFVSNNEETISPNEFMYAELANIEKLMNSLKTEFNPYLEVDARIINKIIYQIEGSCELLKERVNSALKNKEAK